VQTIGETGACRKAPRVESYARPVVRLGDCMGFARRFLEDHPEWSYEPGPEPTWWFDRPHHTSMMLGEDDVAAQVLHDLTFRYAPSRPPTRADIRFIVDCVRWLCLEARA